MTLVAARERWVITAHAVRRFIQRFRRGATFSVARAELVALSEMAHLVKEIDFEILLFRAPKPTRARLIVSVRGNGAAKLITVLAPFDRRYILPITKEQES